jgi:phage-related protein
MPLLAFYRTVWEELSAADSGLRAACKGHLDRLARARPGEASGLRLEKVHSKVTELKISWNKQEFRLLFFHGPNHTVFVVHFFQKKTRKTPTSEINLAIKRREEVLIDQTIVTSGTFH